MAHTSPSETSTVERAGGNGKPVTSAGVQGTLAVLDLLAAGSPLSLSEISRELGIAKSTLHRICNVLVERGWAVRDREGRFDLGIRALRLGSSSAELPVVTAFRTVAVEFLTRHDETIAIEDTSQPVRLVTHVGSKTPAFASASGRVVLASQPPAEVAAIFGGRPLVAPTGRRLNGVAELESILAEVRARGYAENWEETAEGLYAASVPITNDSAITLAALTTLIPISRITPERREAIVADLVALGARLSGLVHWLPSFSSRRP